MNESQENRIERIEVESMDQLRALFGNFDENANIIQEEMDVQLVTREGEILLCGAQDKPERARVVVEKLLELANAGETIDRGRIRYVAALVQEGKADSVGEVMADVVAVTYKGKPVKCRTAGQRRYIEAIRKNTVVLGIGPAGTGKTYLAVAMAVKAF